MSDAENSASQNSGSKGGGSSDGAREGRRRRKLWIVSGSIAAVLVLLGLAIFVLPTYAARWLLDSTLEDAGLEASGIETVEIDLWNREVWFGPIAIGKPGSEPARLERFGLVFSISRLLERQGLGKRIVIDGIVLDVARDGDGRILINGVDLFSLLPPEPATDSATAEETETSWGLGTNDLTLRNSRARFSQPGGGELVLEIDSFTLQGFRTWTPDTPGQFALTAKLNEIGIDLHGEASPFAERIELRISSKISAIEMEKVERFTGPLGLARGKGALHADLENKIDIAPDGRIEIGSNGDIRADGLSLALPDGPALTVDKAVVTLDTDEVIEPDGSGRLTGSIALDGTLARLDLPALGMLDLGATALKLNDIDVRVDASQAISGGLSAQLTTENGAADLDGLKAAFAGATLSAELSKAAFDLSGALKAELAAELSATDLTIEQPVSGGAERLALSLTNTRITRAADGMTIDGAAALRGATLQAQMRASEGDPPLSIRAHSLAMDASRFDLALPDQAPPTWRIAFGLEGGNLAATVGGDRETSVRVGGLRATDAALDSALHVTIAELSLAVVESETDGTVAAKARLGAATLAGIAASAAPMATVGSAALTEFTLSMDDGKALDLRFAELALREAEWTGAPAFRLGAGTLAGLTVAASTKLLALQAPAAPTSVVADDTAPPAGSTDAPGAREASADADTSTTPLPELRIGRFALADPARISLIDQRQSPATTLKLDVSRLSVAGLDSTEPTAKPALELAAKINDFSTLTADGWLNPFGQRPNFELTTTLENLELPTFSRYAAEHLGVNLETGRLGVRTEGQMIEGVLDVGTHLRLKNLKFSPLSPEDAARLSATAGVPVETAVGLLEDSDGLIELSIPIKGDIDNPQFELDQVINKAIGNAIAGTIATTIKVIFPPALLISVISSASGEAGVQLAPAQFEAGTTTLKPQGRELVEALGTLLKERPKLSVTVCGRATTADLEVMLSAEIDALLAQRSEAYQQELADYRALLQPFIDQGIVDETGKLLVDNPPDALPQPPALTPPDRAAIADELVGQRQNEQRDALVDLAAQRTRSVRIDLSEHQGVSDEQVAECRPVFDPQDQEPPRLIVNF